MYVKVAVKTGARREECTVLGENRLQVAVRERAERNLANRRVMELAAAHFDVPLKSVRIISGHHRASKLLLVEL